MQTFEVEIIYALPNRSWKQQVVVKQGQTPQEAYQASGLNSQVGEPSPPLAIFGKIVENNDILQPGDRIDVLRPLTLDPKTSRRERVAQAKKRKSLKKPQDPSASI